MVRTMIAVTAVVIAAVAGLLLLARFGPGASPAAHRAPVELPAATAPAIFEVPPRPALAAPADESPTAATIAALREESFEIAEQAVKDLPNNPHSLSLLASVHYRYAADASAVRLWERCLQLDPRFADAHQALGVRASFAGDFATAERHFRTTLEIDPARTGAAKPLAEALLGQSKYREAVNLLEPHVLQHADDADAWRRLGQAYYQLKDYKNARRCQLAAVAVDPRSPDAHYGAARACEMCGDSEQARQHFDEFRKLSEEEGRAKRATQVTFTDETRTRNTLVKLCLAAGEVYVRHDKPHAAERLWRRAAELDPRDRESRETLCEWLVYQRQLPEAIPFCQALCELDAENPSQWLRLGVLFAQTRKLDEAATSFRKAIEIAPAKAAGYAALAEIQMLPGRDLAEGLLLAQKAVALEPSAHHYYLLATAHGKAGDISNARDSLAEAIRLNPGEPEYRAAYARLPHEPR